jgi:mRNA-degrading endonuclease HigB of HigAB toxin-antitoxin module
MLIENIEDGKYKLTVTPQNLLKRVNFLEHKDKFVYQKERTVGFRKDKKLSKFVGLRDGYSKQLEFSLISIILDGVEKIPKSRVNFNSVDLEDDWVVHTINKIKIFNEVDGTNYRNMIEINNPLSSLEIIYEIHTKGVKVSNRLSNNKYIDNNDQYTLVDNGNRNTMFVLDCPVVIDNDGNEYKIVEHILYKEGDRLLYKKVLGKITNKYNFPLYVDANVIYDLDLNGAGVGIISSSGTSWSSVKSGSNLFLEHTSSIGTSSAGIGVQVTSSTYKLYRTYVNFDTHIFSGVTDCLSSFKFLFNSFPPTDQGIWLMSGSYSSGSISTSLWNTYGYELDSSPTINMGSITEFTLPLTYLNTTGITSFVLLSQIDFTGSTPTSGLSSLTGVDFDGTTIEVIYEPIMVYGQTELNVVKGDYFFLSGYTNSGLTPTEKELNRSYIQWFKDSGYTQLINSGASLNYLYSMEYEYPNNNIYAVISGITGWSQPLIIKINVIQLAYETIPVKNIDYDEIDIDSIYFKYHKCFSGVCYSYVRDINNIYEGFPLVSDYWGDASYNLYNEFDIVDEFFNNSHEVEVAYNLNLDLSKKYKYLDGVPLHEGTRVLLTNQTDVTELGVYVVQYDFTLSRIDELNTYDDMFRYKAHVGAGTYFDQEIHIWPILPPPSPPYIQVNPDPAVLDFFSGATIIIVVASDTTWTLYNAIPWVNVDTSYGVGNKTITLIATMNNLTSAIREGTIEFTGFGGITTVLQVQQNPDTNEEYRILTDGFYRETTDGFIRILDA